MLVAAIELPPQASTLVQLGVGGAILLLALYIITPLLRDVVRKNQPVPALAPSPNSLGVRSIDDFRRDVSAVVHTVVADRNRTDLIPILENQMRILREVSETNKAMHLLLAQIAAKEL